MAQTIAQWIKGKLFRPAAGAQEAKLYNPLNLQVGRFVKLDLPDYERLDFQVERVQEYANAIGGDVYRFAAYDLLARPLGGKPVRVQLRAEATEDARPEAGARLDVLLLGLREDVSRAAFERDNGVDLYQIVELDGTGAFEVRDDATDALEARYVRPDGVLHAMRPTVTVLQDLNHDGVVAADEVRRRTLEYWDYSREIADAAGNPVAEYLIVELEDRAWWKVWLGRAIDASVVQDF